MISERNGEGRNHKEGKDEMEGLFCHIKSLITHVLYVSDEHFCYQLVSINTKTTFIDKLNFW